MGLVRLKACAAVILIFLWGALSSPSCPPPCLCRGTSVMNCSSLRPPLPPLHLPTSVTVLDLSQNSLFSVPFRPEETTLPRLTRLYLGHNRLAHLSVCMAPPTGEGLCETWAPALEILSAERNHLQHVPQGVCRAAPLHTLHLPYNRISALEAQDLGGCAQLQELHLQHNLISTLHPLSFSGLQRLRVLDLSFNALRTLPVPAYLSLHSLRTQVDVSGNPWRCDCTLQALGRWMGVSRPRPSWRVVCAEPPAAAGRDLLHLHPAELTCDTPAEGAGPHQEVTVDPGAELLLPCAVSDQDLSRALWWTPDGSVRQADAQARGGLLIRGVGEQDQGLYLCVSGVEQEPASTFTVRVRAPRGAESAQGGAESALGGAESVLGGAESVPRAGNSTRADLALAVCLSVFLTFIAAFVLGALTRPLLDILWGKLRAWRRPKDTPTDTPTPYTNRGFSGEAESVLGEAESDQEAEAGREGLGKTGAPYYITILPESGAARTQQARGERDTAPEEEGPSGAAQQKRPAPQPVPRRGQQPPRGEELRPWGGGAQDGSTGANQSNSSSEQRPSHLTYTVEFEPIPDPQDLGIERYSSTGSDQSKSDPDPDLHPDCDLGPDLDRDFSPSFGHDLSDPCPLSSEEFAAGRSTDARPPLLDPFSAAAWTDSPWEPHPFSEQAPPTPASDPELWNDSGESFKFSDLLPETALTGSLNLSPQLKEGPWSRFDQSGAGQYDSHDPALLWGGGQEEDRPPGLSSSALYPDSAWLDPEISESGELAPPEGGTADAPWVIHEASQTGVNPGSCVGGDSGGRGTRPGLGSARDPAGQAGGFGGADLVNPQDPTPADPPYPIKPRRSFHWHTTPPPQREDTPPPSPRRQDTPPPSPQQEDTPPPSPQQEDTPPPSPQREDTPPPPPQRQDTPPPITQQEDTPPPSPQREDTPPPITQQEDTPPPSPQREDTPPPITQQEDTPPPSPQREDTPPSITQQEDTPPPSPQREDTPPPPPQREDTPPPPPQQEDTPPPSPQQEDTPPPPPQQEDMPPPSPQQEDTPLSSPQQEDTPPASPQQADMPPASPREDTPPPTRQGEDTPPVLPQREDTPPLSPQVEGQLATPSQGAWPLPVEGQLATPSQGAWPLLVEGQLATPSQVNLKLDWRRGGLFPQRKRAMDAFAPPSQALPLPGSTHLPFGSVTGQTVTMAAGHSPSGEGSTGGDDDVTSDPTSCFLFGSCQDKGSEA